MDKKKKKMKLLRDKKKIKSVMGHENGETMGGSRLH